MPIEIYSIGAFFAFLFGIVVGSFLNVCIYRLPADESLVTPPSHCPRCQHRLQPRDLFPLFSFLVLRGKCRYCKAPISWRYFTIELITGVLFAACWVSLALQQHEAIFSFPAALLVVFGCMFIAAMLVTFMIDLDTTLVILPVTWVAMAAGVLFELTKCYVDVLPVASKIGSWTIPYLPAAVPGMIVGFLVFIFMDLFGRLIFRKPSMGTGDAFIGAAIGAMLGPALALLSFAIAIFLGAIIGILLMIIGVLRRKPSPMPNQNQPPVKKKNRKVSICLSAPSSPPAPSSSSSPPAW